MSNRILSIFLNSNGMAVVVVWGVVLISALGVVNNVKQLVTYKNINSDYLTALQEVSQISITNKLLTSADYEAIAKKMDGLYPNSSVSLSPDGGIKIIVNNINDYGILRDIIKDIMGFKSMVQWKVVNMCAGRQCGTAAYTVIIQGEDITLNYYN